nr:92KD protein [Fijivirus sp.]
MATKGNVDALNQKTLNIGKLIEARKKANKKPMPQAVTKSEIPKKEVNKQSNDPIPSKTQKTDSTLSTSKCDTQPKNQAIKHPITKTDYLSSSFIRFNANKELDFDFYFTGYAQSKPVQVAVDLFTRHVEMDQFSMIYLQPVDYVRNVTARLISHVIVHDETLVNKNSPMVYDGNLFIENPKQLNLLFPGVIVIKPELLQSITADVEFTISTSNDIPAKKLLDIVHAQWIPYYMIVDMPLVTSFMTQFKTLISTTPEPKNVAAEILSKHDIPNNTTLLINTFEGKIDDTMDMTDNLLLLCDVDDEMDDLSKGSPKIFKTANGVVATAKKSMRKMFQNTTSDEQIIGTMTKCGINVSYAKVNNDGFLNSSNKYIAHYSKTDARKIIDPNLLIISVDVPTFMKNIKCETQLSLLIAKGITRVFVNPILTYVSPKIDSAIQTVLFMGLLSLNSLRVPAHCVPMQTEDLFTDDDIEHHETTKELIDISECEIVTKHNASTPPNDETTSNADKMLDKVLQEPISQEQVDVPEPSPSQSTPPQCVTTSETSDHQEFSHHDSRASSPDIQDIENSGSSSPIGDPDNFSESSHAMSVKIKLHSLNAGLKTVPEESESAVSNQQEKMINHDEKQAEKQHQADKTVIASQSSVSDLIMKKDEKMRHVLPEPLLPLTTELIVFPPTALCMDMNLPSNSPPVKMLTVTEIESSHASDSGLPPTEPTTPNPDLESASAASKKPIVHSSNQTKTPSYEELLAFHQKWSWVDECNIQVEGLKRLVNNVQSTTSASAQYRMVPYYRTIDNESGYCMAETHIHNALSICTLDAFDYVLTHSPH